MPRPQPKTQEVIAFQGSQRIAGSVVENASGDEQQIALIRAISRARQAVLYEFSALNDKWSGVAVATGLTQSAIKLLQQSLLETALVTGTFGLLSKTLVSDEQALAYELQALRDLWPDGLVPASLSGMGGSHADDAILTYDTATAKWGVFSPVLISESGGLSKVTAVEADTDLTLSAGAGDISLVTGGDLTSIIVGAINLSAITGLVSLDASTTLALSSGGAMTLTSSANLNLFTDSGGHVVINPGGGEFILSDLSDGLLQVNAVGTVSELTGTVNGALTNWDTGSQQWIENVQTTAVGGSLTANTLTTGSTVYSEAATTVGSAVDYQISTAGGGNLDLSVSGNLVLTGLANGLLQTDGTAVVSALSGGTDGALCVYDTGTSLWEQNTSVTAVAGSLTANTLTTGATVYSEAATTVGSAVDYQISTAGGGDLDISVDGNLILTGFTNGLLQLGATGIASVFAGSSDGAIPVWDTATSQWLGNTGFVRSDIGVVSGWTDLLGLGGGSITGLAGDLSLLTSVSGDVIINPAGSLILTDLLSGMLLVSAAGVVSRLQGSVDNAPALWDTGTSQWVEGSLTASTSAKTQFATTDTSGGLTTRTIQISKIIYIEDNEATDNFPLAYIPQAATIVSVVHKTDTGTVDYNIEKRSKLTPDSAGTNLWTADEQASSTGEEITSFTSASVSAGSWLTFAGSAVASSPTKLWVAVTLELA